MNKTKKSKKIASVASKTDVTKRVNALLRRMSLEEKIGQLNQAGGAEFVPGPKAEDQIRKGGAGSVLWLNDTKRFNELQKIAVEESPSGIPLLFALDVIHGYRTIFPVPLAMASSWDPAVPGPPPAPRRPPTPQPAARRPPPRPRRGAPAPGRAQGGARRALPRGGGPRLAGLDPCVQRRHRR